ncbi:M48 family metallopeptidase, partial [candidate division WWE3 bacterium]|nr:M48 family metallopeptidase [candidate division WWE3 bacterium]
ASFTASRFDYKEYGEKAREIITRRVEYYAKKYNYSFNKLAIRNQKSRWGSCSKKGNLNFNYRIIFLPAKLRDYVIFHELCHLTELNHSKNFWLLVAREFPEYKDLRNQLSEFRI